MDSNGRLVVRDYWPEAEMPIEPARERAMSHAERRKVSPLDLCRVRAGGAQSRVDTGTLFSPESGIRYSQVLALSGRVCDEIH